MRQNGHYLALSAFFCVFFCVFLGSCKNQKSAESNSGADLRSVSGEVAKRIFKFVEDYDQHHEVGVAALVAVPNKKSLVVSGGLDHRIKVWNSDTHKFIKDLRLNNSEILPIVKLINISVDGRNLVAVFESGEVIVWTDFLDSDNPKTFKIKAEGSLAAIFSQAKQSVVVYSTQDGSLFEWAYADEKAKPVLISKLKNDAFAGMIASKNGKYLIAKMGDWVDIYDFNDLKEPVGHINWGTKFIIDVDFADDQKLIAIAGVEGHIAIGRRYITNDHTYEQTRTIQVPAGFGDLNCINFSKYGHFVITGYSSGLIGVDVWSKIASPDGSGVTDYVGRSVYSMKPIGITQMALDEDKNVLVFGAGDGHIREFNFSSTQYPVEVPSDLNKYPVIQINGEGTEIAGAFNGSDIGIYNIKSGKITTTIPVQGRWMPTAVKQAYRGIQHHGKCVAVWSDKKLGLYMLGGPTAEERIFDFEKPIVRASIVKRHQPRANDRIILPDANGVPVTTIPQPIETDVMDYVGIIDNMGEFYQVPCLLKGENPKKLVKNRDGLPLLAPKKTAKYYSEIGTYFVNDGSMLWRGKVGTEMSELEAVFDPNFPVASGSNNDITAFDLKLEANLMLISRQDGTLTIVHLDVDSTKLPLNYTSNRVNKISYVDPDMQKVVDISFNGVRLPEALIVFKTGYSIVNIDNRALGVTMTKKKSWDISDKKFQGNIVKYSSDAAQTFAFFSTFGNGGNANREVVHYAHWLAPEVPTE